MPRSSSLAANRSLPVDMEMSAVVMQVRAIARVVMVSVVVRPIGPIVVSVVMVPVMMVMVPVVVSMVVMVMRSGFGGCRCTSNRERHTDGSQGSK